MKPNSISLEEKRVILNAVVEAERVTSVEFQVHIDKVCREDVNSKANAIFNLLHLNKTKTKSWVLFYLSLEDMRFAIVSDKYIEQIVPDNFWDDVQIHMKEKINEGNFAESLTGGISLAGIKLKKFIPKKKNDYNELPDEIVLGKEIKELVS